MGVRGLWFCLFLQLLYVVETCTQVSSKEENLVNKKRLEEPERGAV